MTPRFRGLAAATAVAAAVHHGLLAHAQTSLERIVNVAIEAIECLESVIMLDGRHRRCAATADGPLGVRVIRAYIRWANDT